MYSVSIYYDWQMEQKGQQMNLIASLICFIDINIIKIVGKFILFSPQDKLVGCLQNTGKKLFFKTSEK